MKKILAVITIVLMGISLLAYPWITPSCNILEEGYVAVDAFNPAWGIRYGLFGFMEAGAGQPEGGTYLKFGFNRILDIPLSFSVGYSNDFISNAYFFTGTELNLDIFRIGFGGMLGQNRHYNTVTSTDEYKLFPSVYGRTSIVFEKKTNIENSFSIEGAMRSDMNLTFQNCMVAFYGKEKIKNLNFLWFKDVDILGGIVFTTSDFSKVDLLKDFQIVLGMSTGWKFF